MKKVLFIIITVFILSMTINVSLADDFSTYAWGDEAGDIFIIGRNYDAGSYSIVLKTENYFYFPLRNVDIYQDPDNENIYYFFSNDTIEDNSRFFIKIIVADDNLTLYIKENVNDGKKFEEPLVLHRLK